MKRTISVEDEPLISHLDRLGTNAKTTDASGSVVDSKRHDAFGLPRLVSSAAGSQKGFASAFGYQEDAESGLKLLGHRYYDAGTGCHRDA